MHNLNVSNIGVMLLKCPKTCMKKDRYTIRSLTQWLPHARTQLEAFILPKYFIVCSRFICANYFTVIAYCIARATMQYNIKQ